MPRIRVGPADEIKPGQPAFVKHGEVEIAVFRLGGGFRAYRNRCPHQQGPVCRGPVSGTLVATADTDWRLAWVLEGRVLICPWHGMEFDLDSGRRLRGRSERLRAYPVELDNGQVYVQVGRRRAPAATRPSA
jgi:nitrite reductase (NADH) small subunit